MRIIRPATISNTVAMKTTVRPRAFSPSAPMYAAHVRATRRFFVPRTRFEHQRCGAWHSRTGAANPSRPGRLVTTCAWVAATMSAGSAPPRPRVR